MKIAEYNDMMSYLTRPAPQTQVADLVDDLEPGPLKDELKEKFDPDQETYEEYLQRKGLGERPFNSSEGGSPKEEIVEPSKSMQVDTTTKGLPDPLEEFKKQSDLYLQASFASTNKDYFKSLIEQEYNKALEAGVQPQEAISFLKERSQMYRTLAEEGRMQGEPAILGPSYGRENFAESIEPKVEKFKELVEKGDSLNDAKNKVINLFKLKRSKTAGTPVWYTVGKKELIKEGVLEDKERGKMKIIGETEDFSKDKNIERIERKGSGEENIKKVTYRNKSTGETFVKYKPLLRSNTVSVSGAGFDTIEEAIKVRDDYNEANPKKVAVTLKLEEDLRKLASSPRLTPLLKTGTPDKKYLKVVQDILGLNVSQAEDKLKQLGEAVRPGSTFDVPGIDKISEKKAKNISNFYKSKSVSKTVVDREIGKSVGEKSLKTLRQDVQKKLPFPGGPETFETDEAKAKMSSFRLGSKPYSIFGQVIDGRLNQGDKMRVDSLLSTLEESVQKALRGELLDKKGNKIPVKVAVEKYNAAATQAEKEFNKQKMRNFKPVRIPKITLDSPDKAIANKAAYKKYKQYFDKNYKQLGYSFKIPKDLKPIPEIAADLKNTNSSEYKNMIRNVKEIGKKFIKDINKYDEKDLLKIFNDPKFQKFKRLMPRLVSNDDFSERRYASANNIMSDATYVDDEEQTFAERNPITTGVGLTVPSAVAVQKAAGVPILKALANIGKYPLKAVGSLPGAAYFAGDTIAERLEEGKSIPDAVIDKEVGIELLLPEAFKRFGPLMMKAARVSTPIGAGITGLGLAKDYYNFAKDEIAKVKAMSPEERQAYNESLMNYSIGGRVGFAEGPEDPSKRKFMKIMGGLASLPILGRFFKIGEKAAPIIDAVKTEAAKGKPEWFDALVNKVIRMGEDVTERFATKDREIVNQIDIADGETVRVYRDIDEGAVRVEYESPDNVYGDPIQMQYKKPLPDEGDPRPSAEFTTAESGPVGRAFGPDDYEIEIDEIGGTDIKDLSSDVSKLKEFATGQKPTMKEIVQNKKRKDKAKAISEGGEDEMQAVIDRQGEFIQFDDINPDPID